MLKIFGKNFYSKVGDFDPSLKTYKVFGARRKKGDDRLKEEDLYYLNNDDFDEIQSVRNYKLHQALENDRIVKEEEERLFGPQKNFNKIQKKKHKGKNQSNESQGKFDHFSHHDYTPFDRDFEPSFQVFDALDGGTLLKTEKEKIKEEIFIDKIKEDQKTAKKPSKPKKPKMKEEWKSPGLIAFEKNISLYKNNYYDKQ